MAREGRSWRRARSSSILLEKEAKGLVQELTLCLAIVAVCAASYLVLRLSAHGSRWMSPIALRLTTRIMGLMLAAVAVQFFLNALVELKVIAPAA